jgi:hypothetical protein
MRVRLGFTFLFFLIGSVVQAQELYIPTIKQNTVFKAGEKLSYQIKYGFIVGGTTTLTLEDAEYNNKPVFHAVAIGETTGVAEQLYGVKDIYESWFDKETNLPYKQIRNIKEGSYTKYNVVTYDRENNTVYSMLSGLHQVPEKTLDLASTFYYLRRIDYSRVKDGDVIFVNMYFADEIFPFQLRYRGKEALKTKFGKINCLKICPVVEAGRMFKTQDGLTIWFTDDGNFLPVLVRMDIRIVGSVILKLVKYENIVNQSIIEIEE